MLGMFLAAPGLPLASAVVFGTLGIALVAGAAAAINCLVEQEIDAVMARTRARPLPRGEISSLQTLLFACASDRLDVSDGTAQLRAEVRAMGAQRLWERRPNRVLRPGGWLLYPGAQSPGQRDLITVLGRPL